MKICLECGHRLILRWVSGYKSDTPTERIYSCPDCGCAYSTTTVDNRESPLERYFIG